VKADAVPDLMIVLGLALLAGGLAAFDWRLAMVVCGLVLLLLGLVGAIRR
jgi:type IV secretory pathway VirB2 component (pilin)